MNDVIDFFMKCACWLAVVLAFLKVGGLFNISWQWLYAWFWMPIGVFGFMGVLAALGAEILGCVIIFGSAAILWATNTLGWTNIDMWWLFVQATWWGFWLLVPFGIIASLFTKS